MIKWLSQTNLGSVLTQIYADMFTVSDAVDDIDERVGTLESAGAAIAASYDGQSKTLTLSLPGQEGD